VHISVKGVMSNAERRVRRSEKRGAIRASLIDELRCVARRRNLNPPLRQVTARSSRMLGPPARKIRRAGLSYQELASNERGLLCPGAYACARGAIRGLLPAYLSSLHSFNCCAPWQLGPFWLLTRQLRGGLAGLPLSSLADWHGFGSTPHPRDSLAAAHPNSMGLLSQSFQVVRCSRLVEDR
jgi:hypothetical protein